MDVPLPVRSRYHRSVSFDHAARYLNGGSLGQSGYAGVLWAKTGCSGAEDSIQVLGRTTLSDPARLVLH